MVGYLWHNARHLAHLAWHAQKVRHTWQRTPRKPVVINLNANDICNSKCTMCNIWKQKKDVQLSPEEFFKVLSDPLFSEIRHVGVTGGEPTMRDDLPQVYEAIIKSLPKLEGLSIITNAIRTEDVKQRIVAVNEVCKRHGKGFSVMVSMDGFEDMHDTIRGRAGNFASAVEVIRFVKTLEGVPVSIGSTISKENVYHVDDLLDFMRKEGIYGRFRVAEFIKRLYNEDRGDVIRNFSDDELYHLQVFYHKLEATFEQNPEYKRTYRNIRRMLGGAKREMGCPYQAEGVVVDARGDLQYCAPKSNKIGNGLAESAEEAYTSQLEERRRILAKNCDDCLHDYHYPEVYTQARRRISEEFWLNLLRLDFRYSRKKQFIINALYQRARIQAGLATRATGSAIVGWYGTETVGDKAILGGVMMELRKRFPGEPIRVVSLNPYVTERTRLEMSEDFEIVDAYDSAFFRTIAQSSRVVMGGGPLMDVDELSIVLIAAQLARRHGKGFEIAGCGIGPLNHEDYRSCVEELVRLATRATFRDEKSAQMAREWTGRTDITMTGDPSVPYLRSLPTYGKAPQEKINQVAVFFRELPGEYRKYVSKAEYIAERTHVEEALAHMLRQLHERLGCTIALYSMHTHFIGGDDRDFYRRFVHQHLPDLEGEIKLERGPSTIEQIVEAMQTSRFVLPMRFHSVVFAHTLGANFIALDYTAGGKIHNFLHDRHQLGKYIDVRSLEMNTSENVIETLLAGENALVNN